MHCFRLMRFVGWVRVEWESGSEDLPFSMTVGVGVVVGFGFGWAKGWMMCL